jgi:hypothetical protein
MVAKKSNAQSFLSISIRNHQNFRLEPVFKTKKRGKFFLTVCINTFLEDWDLGADTLTFSESTRFFYPFPEFRWRWGGRGDYSLQIL